MTGPDGLDRAGLERWFAEHVPAAAPPLEYERIAGGRSNLTFRVTDRAGSAWILRRPPLGERLASAHDMGREHRILAGLAGTAVPVPSVVGLCTDETVTGAEFYVMEFVQGAVLRGQEDVEAAFGPERRRAVGESVVDTLVALHAVDPEAVGLGGLGRHDGYAERQLRRWKRQWDASKTREVEAMETVHRLLSERVPPPQGVTFVHGDYRLDNLVVSPAGSVAAVLDWELCTLGDPIADLGLLLIYWAEPGDAVVPLTRAPTLAPGFPGRAELRERYAAASGRDLASLDFFLALGQWKLAAILEGVLARTTAGAYGDADPDAPPFARIVEQLAAGALESAERLP